MSNHTPGIWWAVDISDGDDDRERFAVYSGQTTAVALDATENDARLIAAAPDLLAALQGVYASAPISPERKAAIGAVISNATGETP